MQSEQVIPYVFSFHYRPIFMLFICKVNKGDFSLTVSVIVPCIYYTSLSCLINLRLLAELKIETQTTQENYDFNPTAK